MPLKLTERQRQLRRNLKYVVSGGWLFVGNPRGLHVLVSHRGQDVRWID